jgi:sugar O-acyltransferase (sialic acid O-acetyltransferase NeuD family)
MGAPEVSVPVNSQLPLIVIGGGGHAKVLISTLLLQQREVLGFVDVKPSVGPVLGVPRLGDDGAVQRHSPKHVQLVNGIGSIGCTAARRSIYDRFRQANYIFANVIHPAAVIAPDVELEDGVQVMAGAVVQPGTRLGSDAIINTGARIDHDCVIESHAHVAPGAVLSGHVHVGSGSHIGAGACILQHIIVGARVTVGAGAVVLRDVPADVTVVGIPASRIGAFASPRC